MSTKRVPPKAYDDPPETKVSPLDDGYELVERPDRTFVRKRLTKGKKRHARLQELQRRGWEVISMRGTGAVRPGPGSEHGDGTYSIAAAALTEGID